MVVHYLVQKIIPKYIFYITKKGRFHGALLPCGKKTPKGILVLPQEVSTLFKDFMRKTRRT